VDISYLYQKVRFDNKQLLLNYKPTAHAIHFCKLFVIDFDQLLNKNKHQRCYLSVQN